jgi:hypothetical protein
MADVTRTIGTAGRNYSTMTAWEADLDNGAVYSATDNAIGDCYNDSTFTDTLTLNGGGTIGLNSILLKPATGQGHTGVANTGVKVSSSGASTYTIRTDSALTTTLQSLELTRTTVTGFTGGVRNGVSSHTHQRLLIYNITSSSGETLFINSTSGGTLLNNICFNCTTTATGSTASYGINCSSTSGTIADKVINNTFYNVTNDNGSGVAHIIRHAGSSPNRVFQNNIAVTVGGTTSGTKLCYNITAGTRTNNLSSDATATGTNSLINKSATNQFLSIVGGSENLHLKAGADAIGAGIDLVTTPTGVQFDINGYDRDVGGDVWDMGADQFAKGNSIPSFNTQYYHRYLGRMG